VTDFELIAEGMTQAVPFIGLLGLEITAVSEGEAKVRLPERQELRNHVGSQHAGALFGAAEAASGAAFVGAFAERMEDVTPLARRADISYEKVARGPIEASAKLNVPAQEALAALDRDGKVEFAVDVLLRDESGAQVASATIQWHVRRKEPTAAAS
jgi:acyl-coenzyme A thioesterase PaaI-like protein